MIPEYIEIPNAPWRVLPAGMHQTSLEEVKSRFAINNHRRKLFIGLISACKSLKYSGVDLLYLDGSFVTEKPVPSDYDACWDTSNVDRELLNPVFLDFSNKRENQKREFGGEFFPYAGKFDFVDFFQTEKHSGERKGILLIKLQEENLNIFEER